MASSASGSAQLASDLEQEIAQEPSQEPSMEEILASIKQIIADDEPADDGLTERERYSHPSDHSNSNEVSPEDITEDLEADLEQAMAAELGLDVADSETADVPVEEVQPVVAETPIASELPAETNAGETIEERAERVRNAVSAAGAGMSAEERIEKYRIRGKLKMETLAAKAAEPKLEAAPIAPPVSPAVAAGPMLPTTAAIAQEMAAVMMVEKSKEIETMLSDLMRPTIRQWLSDNLPGMVERLVREEIEAVSRGKKVS